MNTRTVGEAVREERLSYCAVESVEDVFDQPPINVWLVAQCTSPSQRRGRYYAQSFVHPAKMLPELARRIITTYSKPGDFVVDPMSGIGTTGVEALRLGRRYVGIEIDPGYAELQEKNLQLARSQGYQDGRIICADAREDSGLRNVDLVMFSPPYQDAIHNQGDELGRIRRKIENGTASAELVRRFGNWKQENEWARAGLRPAGYSRDARNVGHFKGDRYWEAMGRIYEGVYAALRPNGYLAVVTKDQRDRKTGELTNLYGETVLLCKSIGFILHEHIAAILCAINEADGITPRTSLWQRMAIPRALEKGTVKLIGQFEDVAVFMKGPSVPPM